jgi:hypothetical protein
MKIRGLGPGFFLEEEYVLREVRGTVCTLPFPTMIHFVIAYIKKYRGIFTK